MVGTLATVGAISVTAAGSALAASGIVMFAKPSKLSGKKTSSNKPSWVTENMLDPNLSAQQNAKNASTNFVTYKRKTQTAQA